MFATVQMVSLVTLVQKDRKALRETSVQRDQKDLGVLMV
jgi:hypothetical protein